MMFKFNRIMIVDLSNKEARYVSFSAKKTLLTSTKNHLGKSLIMKSLFYTLGAEVFFSMPIRKISLFTYVDFSLNGTDYRVCRLKDRFCLFCNGEFIERYHSVASFGEKLSEIFDFEIDLVGKDDEKNIVKCPPAFYFLPYYIDQENGWDNGSQSFARLAQFDLPQRKNSYFFHLGVFDRTYVEASKQKKVNEKRIGYLERETHRLSTVIDILKDGMEETLLSFDIQALEKSIENRKEEMSEILESLTKARNRLVEEEDVLVQKEYEKSIIGKYLGRRVVQKEEISFEKIECPQCGFFFERNMAEQLEKMYLKGSLHDDYVKLSGEIVLQERRINKIKLEFEEKQRVLQQYEESLVADRNVYDMYIRSRATNQMLTEYRQQIKIDNQEIDELRRGNVAISKRLGTYIEEHAKVKREYQNNLTDFCTVMDIPASEMDSEGEPGGTLVASGAYGPRGKLAQIFAFLQTKQSESPETISFPVVIDSPNVREQDIGHLETILKSLLMWNKTENQIIVASIAGQDIAKGIDDVEIICLQNEPNHLLTREVFVECEGEIQEMLMTF